VDLAMLGRPKTVARARAAIVRELTFTDAYQTWTKEAETDEIDERDEPLPPLRKRVAAAVRVLAGEQNGGPR
jgi:hypothetical protein